MTSIAEYRIGRPDTTEIAPHAEGYVDLVPGDDLIAGLAQQIGETTRLLEPIGDKRASELRYAPGKWTVKEIVGHLSDTERVFAARVLHIARGDAAPLPGFEQDDYVRTAGSNDRTLDDLLDEFRIVRQSTLVLLRSLTPEAWTRRGRVNDWNLTVRGIAFTIAGHELHHCKVLRERYLG
jgi:hypothetical protein